MGHMTLVLRLALTPAALLWSAVAACDAPKQRDAVEISHGLQRASSTAYTDTGATDDAISMRALVAFPIRDEAGLEATISALYDPARPEFRTYLSVAEWNLRHAPLQADVDVVIDWLRGEGFEIARVADNRLLVEITGPAAAFNDAFSTELRTFVKEDDPDFWTAGTRTDLYAPQAIADRIAALVVADPIADSSPLPPESGSIVETAPDSTRLTLASVGHAYGFDAAGADGDGVTLGVVAGASLKLKDVQSFWRSQSITRPDPTLVNTMEPPATRYTETTLDVEWAGGLAPGADLIAYLGPDAHDTSLVYTFNYAIADGRAHVISDSFAHREDATPRVIRNTYHASAEMAAALGITLVAAAGDSGEPDVPSSSPLVTSVGGTVLTLDASGERSDESGWSFSGAGDSLSFDMPWWQGQLGLADKRAVSDVALAANKYWTYVFGEWKALGGTSFAAPSFAALIAVVDSARIARGKPAVGFLNSTLYTNAAVQAAFRDVVTGGTASRSAAPGWDYPTGWGAPSAPSLIEALP